MVNPYAETFMIAARTRGVAHWEQPHFANKRDAAPGPRLETGAAPNQGRFLGLFRRRDAQCPDAG